MKKGTNIQEIVDSFTIKVPQFGGSINEIVQYMKSSIAKCRRHVYDNLDFEYDPEIITGYFHDKISDSSIEFIAILMASEYWFKEFSKISARRTYLGTQAFNKIPNNTESYNLASKNLEKWTLEAQMFSEELPDYSEER